MFDFDILETAEAEVTQGCLPVAPCGAVPPSDAEMAPQVVVHNAAAEAPLALPLVHKEAKSANHSRDASLFDFDALEEMEDANTPINFLEKRPAALQPPADPLRAKETQLP